MKSSRSWPTSGWFLRLYRAPGPLLPPSLLRLDGIKRGLLIALRSSPASAASCSSAPSSPRSSSAGAPSGLVPRFGRSVITTGDLPCGVSGWSLSA